MNDAMNAKVSISNGDRTPTGNYMKRAWALPGVLIALTFLALACGGKSVEQFPIDETRAIEIAREAGLEPGVKAWRTNYSSHPTEGNVWSVENTLHESSGGADGRLVRIDANTGGVMEFSNWAIAVEEEGALLIKDTREYQSLVDKYGSSGVSVKAVNLHDKSETDFLIKINDGFLIEPGCIIVLKAGKGEGYVYQLDEEFNIVFRMTLSEFEQGASNVDAGTMKHFYTSLE